MAKETVVTINGRDVHRAVVVHGTTTAIGSAKAGISKENPDSATTQPTKQMTLTFFVFKDHETARRYVKTLASSADSFD